jgi:UDP-N-acetylglucosamine 2-epimerase (non-hydrolysing)
MVLVHGDTTTTMVSSLASYYSGLKVCHVEAGLRTQNKWAPFPEEMNRKITGALTDLHLAPSEQARQNLLNEGVPDKQIVVTGNTVIDALYRGLEIIEEKKPPKIREMNEIISEDKRMILVTGHRRENFGDGFLNICHALREIADRGDVQVIYPVHLNPNVQKPVYEILGNHEHIKLIDPQPYEAFIHLMNRAHIIITDSGGVQEEAPSLGKPVLVMRETTERPEAVDAGTVILVGTDKEKIIFEAKQLLDDEKAYKEMSMKHNPYGDGKACKRIAEHFIKLQEAGL